MKNIYGGPNPEQTKVSISGKKGRDTDSESQENIFDPKGYRLNDGIVIVKTVDVS